VVTKFLVCAGAQDGFEPFKQRGCVTKQVGLSTIGVGILKNVVFTVI
jgi:hypothetical protein